MKNEKAIKLQAIADKRLAWFNKEWPNDKSMLKCGQQDHKDLSNIALMIDNEENEKNIAKAMWNLDTAVRDDIPDDIYYHYVK